jgi:hypothetical protein
MPQQVDERRECKPAQSVSAIVRNIKRQGAAIN